MNAPVEWTWNGYTRQELVDAAAKAAKSDGLAWVAYDCINFTIAQNDADHYVEVDDV